MSSTLKALSPNMLSALASPDAIKVGSPVAKSLELRGLITTTGKTTPLGQQIADLHKVTSFAVNELQGVLKVAKAEKVRNAIEDTIAVLDGQVSV